MDTPIITAPSHFLTVSRRSISSGFGSTSIVVDLPSAFAPCSSWLLPSPTNRHSSGCTLRRRPRSWSHQFIGGSIPLQVQSPGTTTRGRRRTGLPVFETSTTECARRRWPSRSRVAGSRTCHRRSCRSLENRVFLLVRSTIFMKSRPTKCRAAPIRAHQGATMPHVVGVESVRLRNFGMIQAFQLQPPNLPLADIDSSLD